MQRATGSSSPPTKTERVPAAAPSGPPDTVASTRWMPASAAGPRSESARSRSLVDVSIQTAAGGMAVNSCPPIMPTWAGPGSEVRTTSASPAAASTDSTMAIPVREAVARCSATRSKPETWCPAAARLAAIGPPMWPRPITRIRMEPPEVFHD